MQTRLIAVFVTGSVLAAFAGGILFEHYVGTNAMIDWVGLRDRVIVHQVRSTADRGRVTLPTPARGRTMVALVFGQSNAGNGGESRGHAHPGVHEFYRGRIYDARDPLLGAGGDGGSVWLRLAAKAVASGEFDSVVLVPFAVGASEIARWAPGGSLHDGLLSVLGRARDGGLAFTHLLWQQGEADAIARTSGEAYREKFLAMLAAIRRQGVNAPIYVARATRCGKVRPSEEIGNVQSGLTDPALGILAGPDTDALGFAERYDGCHFSTEGLEHAAELWLGAIQAGGPAPVPR
jgi:hypothetical protein